MVPKNASQARAAILELRYLDDGKTTPCVERIDLPLSQQFQMGGETVVAFSKDSNGMIDGHFVADTPITLYRAENNVY